MGSSPQGDRHSAKAGSCRQPNQEADQPRMSAAWHAAHSTPAGGCWMTSAFWSLISERAVSNYLPEAQGGEWKDDKQRASWKKRIPHSAIHPTWAWRLLAIGASYGWPRDTAIGGLDLTRNFVLNYSTIWPSRCVFFTCAFAFYFCTSLERASELRDFGKGRIEGTRWKKI